MLLYALPLTHGHVHLVDKLTELEECGLKCTGICPFDKYFQLAGGSAPSHALQQQHKGSCFLTLFSTYWAIKVFILDNVIFKNGISLEFQLLFLLL